MNTATILLAIITIVIIPTIAYGIEWIRWQAAAPEREIAAAQEAARRRARG